MRHAKSMKKWIREICKAYTIMHICGCIIKVVYNLIWNLWKLMCAVNDIEHYIIYSWVVRYLSLNYIKGPMMQKHH